MICVFCLYASVVWIDHFMDLGPVVLNYDIYSKEFQKLQPTHGGTISNSENGQMRNIYR